MNITDNELFEIFANLPVKADKFEHYLFQYAPIIRILVDFCEGYAFAEQIHQVLSKNEDPMSKTTFNSIIAKGVEDNFWGVMNVNKYNVVYLKRNSYLCYLRKERSSIKADRITTSMLLYSAMLLSLKFRTIDKLYIDGFGSLYRAINHKGVSMYLLLTTGSNYGSAKKLSKLCTELVAYDKAHYAYDNGYSPMLILCSPVQVSTATKNNLVTAFTGSSIVPRVKVLDVTKYFNGLPITYH